MTNSQPKKPAANHPWRKSVPSEVAAWAGRESYIRDVSNVCVARNETLRRKTPPVIKSR